MNCVCCGKKISFGSDYVVEIERAFPLPRKKKRYHLKCFLDHYKYRRMM